MSPRREQALERAAVTIACLAVGCGCSCGSPRLSQDGPPGQDAAVDVARSDRSEGAPQTDAPQKDAWLPDGVLSQINAPWGPDETRQLQPIEIPAAVAERSCGPDCLQVTLLPDSLCEGAENRYNVSGDYLVTNIELQGSRVIVYVHIPTRKAYAIGVIAPELGDTAAVCLYAVVNSGRVAYTCFADLGTGTLQAEVRLFDIATATERRIYKQTAGPPGTDPNSPGFLADRLVVMNSVKCNLGCTAVFGFPFDGGAGTQLFPVPGEEGGIGSGQASDRYVVWTDTAHFPTHVEVGFLDVTSGLPAARVSNPGVGDRWNARIKGSRVAWMDTRNDPTHDSYNPQNVDIYAKDLATGEEWAACTNSARQDYPDVEGDIVVWGDFRNNDNPYPTQSASHGDIYCANVRTGQEWRLTELTGLAAEPRIDGARAFFRWKPDDSPPQIYMIDLKARGVVQ
jgi:hypothetical protein